jgi:hypothetical protein
VRVARRRQHCDKGSLRLAPEHILIAAILTVLWTASGLAQEPDLINADRPGIAGGSTVVGPGTFQIESGIQAEFRRNDDSREHTLFIPTLLRFGIDSHWEVRIEGNNLLELLRFSRPAQPTKHPNLRRYR